MNCDDSDVIYQESLRLNDLGIPYDHIHCSDGKPVVTVDRDTMLSIISMRNRGEVFDGNFISCKGSEWSASFIDQTGKHQVRSGLTECKAYRWVLGYPVGHYTRHSRYAGQTEYTRTRKQRKKTMSYKS